ncbi:hypothetical protein [Sulfurospirillum barnesii]|uniref:Transcriptional regulator n=1 Tax=Sulfurospirillum barnesii (strain ATCC 700032 / DSM 10660 / SES-3) TaxID=760154 RepID=I3XWE2_SULBS|nr:hypothetical protein [Sulfurospirillum barnesii]AFL68266.1 hypothetical protein Sulba_0965 [Sulfurospirillum barnesii SES-3]
MNKKELAVRLDVSVATLYNWEKTKPELIKLINLGLKDEIQDINEEENINTYYRQLTEEEKEMYMAEIKARVMRKKLK